MFKTPDNVKSTAQIRAFKDTWHWNEESESAYKELLKTTVRIAAVIRGLRAAIKENDMMAYVTMMAIRLVELYRVLKPTGALYLHCDPTASHYLKLVLDSIFGPANFRNEIIWKRFSAHNDATKGYGKITDSIFFYTKSKNYTWNKQYMPYTPEYIEENFRDEDEVGPYTHRQLTAEGLAGGGYEYEYHGHRRIWKRPLESMLKLEREGLIHFPKNKGGIPRYKIYLKDAPGIPVQNLWTDIPQASGSEKLPYPTQKPLALLERIIKTSSNEGDVILDPFCGCCTAIHAAEGLERSWLGIDITHLAIALIEKRMKRYFGTGITVKGVPKTFESAEDLARRDKFQFEAWAVSLIPNALPNEIKVGDEGIDGIGTIDLGKDSKGRRREATVIVSVKGGDNLTPAMVRDLAGTARDEFDKQDNKLRVLVTLKDPTPKMCKEAARAGVFSTPLGQTYPRLQIYTVRDYFDRKAPKLPTMRDYITAKSVKPTRKGRQGTL